MRFWPYAKGECDSCQYFRPEDKAGYRDIGFCDHEDGPQNAHTTRGGKPMSVSAGTRIVSSGMVCDRFQQKAA